MIKPTTAKMIDCRLSLVGPILNILLIVLPSLGSLLSCHAVTFLLTHSLPGVALRKKDIAYAHFSFCYYPAYPDQKMTDDKSQNRKSK